MVAGAVLGARGKPGLGTVAWLEFSLLVVVVLLVIIGIRLDLVVVVPLDRTLTRVKVEVFTELFSVVWPCVLPCRLVLETSVELDRSLVTAVGGFTAGKRVGDVFFCFVFLGSPASAAACLGFVHGRLSLSDSNSIHTFRYTKIYRTVSECNGSSGVDGQP
jgi:hypothetical protein